MSLLFRNWLAEGYYEEDSSGELTRLESSEDILKVQKEGNLRYSDGNGYGLDSVDENAEIK